jgi:hypothetical protein
LAVDGAIFGDADFARPAPPLVFPAPSAASSRAFTAGRVARVTAKARRGFTVLLRSLLISLSSSLRPFLKLTSSLDDKVRRPPDAPPALA